MDNFFFDGLPQNVHPCTSHREGDWIIWRCAQCAGYERRLNWSTGEMRVKRGGSEARHAGIDDHREPGDLLVGSACMN